MGRPHYQRAGEAIHTMRRRAGLTQTDLAARLRALGFNYDQSKVSRWERGLELPSDIEAIPAIERECGAVLGTILRAAGLVDDSAVDVRAAIMADPHLDDILRTTLLAVYDGMLRAASDAAANPSAIAERDAARPAKAMATD